MRKKICFICLVLVIIGGIGTALWRTLLFLNQEVIYIAAVGPNSGPLKVYTEDMLRGIRLYVKTLSREGRLSGKKIQLLTFDDHNDEHVAAQVASDIVRENKVLFVLGHLSSSTSLAAGKIYKRGGVPVITASATAESITQDNEWYFRVIPNNHVQAEFAANYIRYVLGKKSARVVFIQNSYGTSLMRNFEIAARKLGIEIPAKWGIRPDGKNLENQLRRIQAELQEGDDSGAFFLAIPAPEAAAFMTTVKNSEKTYTIIGTDILAEPSSLLPAFSQQISNPGDYTDGIYAISPFMPDVANAVAQEFRREYIDEYGREPSWAAACYYDALAIAVKGMKHTELQGRGNIRRDRTNLRKTLAGFYDADRGLKGVTGDIYFNINRELIRPYAVGIYEQKLFLPAFVQYRTSPELGNDGSLIKRALSGDIILIDQKPMVKTQIVRTGIKIHELSNIDLKNSRYTIDFSLWFRFQGDIDVANFEFVNIAEPIRLEQPVMEQHSDKATTLIFHVKANFKSEIDFHFYPFGAYELPIQFRHSTLTREQLTYVPDTSELPLSLRKPSEKESLFTSLQDWTLSKTSVFQDVISHISTLGYPEYFGSEHAIQYSRFNVVLQMKRASLRFAVEMFSPLIAMLLLLGFTFTFPSNRIGFRVMICMGILIGAMYSHIIFLIDLPVEYLTPFEYTIFVLYVFIVLSLLGAISAYTFYKRRLALVQGIYLFQPLPERLKVSLSKKMRRRRFKKPGQTIIRQGERGDSLFAIIEGEIAVWISSADGSPVEIARNKTGDFFGEMALLTGEKRTATIISTTPVLLGEIKNVDIAPFLKKYPELVTNMVQKLTQRIRDREALHEISQNEKELFHRILREAENYSGLQHLSNGNEV